MGWGIDTVPVLPTTKESYLTPVYMFVIESLTGEEQGEEYRWVNNGAPLQKMSILRAR